MKAYNVTVKDLGKSEVEIEGEIGADIFEGYRTHALSHLGENIEVDGFRKGKVPEHILLTKIPEMSFLEEMAEHAIGEHYGKMLEQESIEAIGRPEVAITKIAKGNPLGFKIKTAVMPKVTLPDYKKIAKAKSEKQKEVEITDKEVQDTIEQIRKARAPHIEAKEGETTPEPVLPEYNDEFVKSLGSFENVADFETKMKENLKLEKENQAREKNRLTIMEAVLADTKVEIPNILVEAELDKMLYRMKSDIGNMGLSYDDYLKHLGKTEEAIRAEFRTDAEKRVRMELLLAEVAKAENLKPETEAVEAELSKIMEMYKDADPARARLYVEDTLTHEKVFQFLESQVDKK